MLVEKISNSMSLEVQLQSFWFKVKGSRLKVEGLRFKV
jgi:hypothetical protein